MSCDIWSRSSFLLNPLLTVMLAQPLGPKPPVLVSPCGFSVPALSMSAWLLRGDLLVVSSRKTGCETVGEAL